MTRLSPGCAHCYAETFAKRLRGLPGHSYEQGFQLKLWPERLGIPLGTVSTTTATLVRLNAMADARGG